MADRVHKMHLLSWFLAGELSPSDQQAVANHLRVCAVCQQELHLLRQTVAALQALPLEETSVDFVEQLNRRIDQEAKLPHLKEHQQLFPTPAEEAHSAQAVLPLTSGLSKPELATLTQRVHNWWHSLGVPLPLKMLGYTAAATLGLVALLLWHMSSEKATVSPSQSAALAPLPSVPLSQRVTSVSDETMQPVDTVVSATEKLPPSAAPLAPSTNTPSIVAALVWRVAGNEPATRHKQVKALVGRMAGAVIVKEEEHLLLISLPTGKLPALRQELAKMGKVSAVEGDVAPGLPTTLLQLTFVQ